MLLALYGKFLSDRNAMDRLEEYFSTKSLKNKEFIILLIDEVDQLVTGKQSLLYRVLNWAAQPISKLVLLTVANTMDLPERFFTYKNCSRFGLTRLSFMPYTNSQLHTIISNRLSSSNIFKKEAIQLCSQMIGSSTGDARTALDICRMAVDHVSRDSGVLNSGSTEKLVGLDLIQEIITCTFRIPVVEILHASSFHMRMFLYCVYYETRASENEAARFGKVKKRHIQNCLVHSIADVSDTIIQAVCSRLARARFIIIEGFQEGDSMKIRLNVDAFYIEKAIKTDADIQTSLL
ncbi:origin recognition complex subunit 1-like isoform X2 [Zophobas morio]|uniref:origin recognition complex subunit 1-like isoform X2 n=1 Tax=Zophobas morio TaxID=2755281 RepID=UPI0030830CC9